ncbi:putative acetyltransferase EpsM [compost metagenome]
MSYIVYGAGGHAKVVIDILRAAGQRLIGVMDDSCRGDEWNGLKLLGNREQIGRVLLNHPGALFLVAIGDNAIRMSIAHQLKSAGAWFGQAIHPSAILGSNVGVGAGTVLMPGTIVNADTQIGEHVIVNTAATIDHDCRIGSYAHISPGAHLAGGVKVGTAAHIGIGASIIPGIQVGDGTVIGAGACAVRDVPDHVVAVGCPARIINNITGGE